MGLVNITPIEDGTSATANSINEPIGKLAGEINGNLDSANLSNGAVTTAKLADASVTSAKISTSVYVDDNGWTVHDLGTSKTYSRKITISNITIGGSGARSTLGVFQPPIGRTRENVVLMFSWIGSYSGHIVLGAEYSGTAGQTDINAANVWPAALTFNGTVQVTAVESI